MFNIKNKNNEINEKNKNIDKIKINPNNIENSTQYGEFVSSYFAWLTLEKQKNNAKRMEDITNKNNN